MKKVLVILSGGQDSTTCLFLAKSMGCELHAITFNYGQRHAIEIEAAKKVAKLAGVVTHEILDLPGNILKSASPLVSENHLEQYENFEQMDSIIGNRVELTFVPMRNLLFLTIAMNRAIELGCEALITGICQEDNANYPDCREEFRSSFQRCATQAGSGGVDVLAPLMYHSKAETVGLATKLDGCWEALSYSHTSYDGRYPPTDKNHANILRAEGFLKAGLPDPLVLRAVSEGLMALPETENYKNLVFADR